MLKKNKSASDVLAERIFKSCNLIERMKEFEQEKNPDVKMELEYELSKEIVKNSIIEISNLTDLEFNRLKREHEKSLNVTAHQFGMEYLNRKMRVGGISVQDLDETISRGYLTMELRNRKPTPKEKKALSKKKTLERLLFLTKSYIFTLQAQFANVLHDLEPFYEINEIVSKRFGFDQNWNLAIMILATHENLIKKKLTILEMPEEEIVQISRGKGLDTLIEKLEMLIESKEHRKLSLTFYKTSALRKVRNRLEHQGYKQPVKNEEVLELLKDIKTFEKEIFQK